MFQKQSHSKKAYLSILPEVYCTANFSPNPERPAGLSSFEEGSHPQNSPVRSTFLPTLKVQPDVLIQRRLPYRYRQTVLIQRRLTNRYCLFFTNSVGFLTNIQVNNLFFKRNTYSDISHIHPDYPHSKNTHLNIARSHPNPEGSAGLSSLEAGSPIHIARSLWYGQLSSQPRRSSWIVLITSRLTYPYRQKSLVRSTFLLWSTFLLSLKVQLDILIQRRLPYPYRQESPVQSTFLPTLKVQPDVLIQGRFP